MKNLQFNPYQQGAGCGGVGLKSLNLSSPHPVVQGLNLAPSLPHHLCGAGKTHIERSEEGCVKWDGAKLPTLLVMDD